MQCFVTVLVVVSFITLLLKLEINPIPERKFFDFSVTVCRVYSKNEWEDTATSGNTTNIIKTL